MKRSDIPNDHVVDLARRWRIDAEQGVVAALVAEGVPEKLALRKVEHLVDKGLLDYGTSPYYAWPTDMEDQPVGMDRIVEKLDAAKVAFGL